ncbi:ABC transporter substrate-binding protein [Bradyrhizobium sp. 23AC]
MHTKTLRRLASVSALSLVLTTSFAWSQTKLETPRYGGTLEISTVSATLSALSFDSADWPWKHNQDTGAVYEQLFAADLSKAKSRGGSNSFISDVYIPSQLIRGELAEKWGWLENLLRMKVTLRKGVMFPEKPGVMAKRELVADDVVFDFKRLSTSPKAVAKYFDFIKDVRAEDKYTVVFEMSKFNAEWDYRFGYGYYSAIIPKEVVDAGAANWKNVTGPFKLTDYVQGNSQTYEKNPDYWDKETINDKEFKLPYVDKVVYRIIKDEATRNTALRTGKLDIMESIRWARCRAVEKKYAGSEVEPLAQPDGHIPVDARRSEAVRRHPGPTRHEHSGQQGRNHQVVLQWECGAVRLPAASRVYRLLPASERTTGQCPGVVQVRPGQGEKAARRSRLSEWLHLQDASLLVQSDQMDLISLIAAYLEQVGVKMEIQPMEYAAFLSAMMTKTLAPGYLMSSGHTSPTTTIRKNFTTGNPWNASQWNDPKIDERMEATLQERDENKRQALIRTMTTEMLDKAPYLWLPTPYAYTAWWPWVKGYEGELRAGAERPGPIYARIWIDQDLKKKMGY